MESGASTDNNASTLNYTEIESSEKFGPGKVYRIGVVEVVVYENPPGLPPLARIRSPSLSMALSHVSEVKSNNEGGMLLDFARYGEKVHASLSINSVGEIAFIYSPPPPPLEIAVSARTQKVRGIEYTQSTIDVPGTPEGVRVQMKGTVDGAPRPVAPNNRNSPLMFFLIEENPKERDKPVYHEVWAVKSSRQDLKNAKLVKGSVIEAICYRHTFETDLIGGRKEVVTRHNLAKILSFERPSPKEQKI